MAKHEVKNIDGKTVGEIDLDDAVFAAEVKEYLFWEVVKYQTAKKRAGTHSTLRRDEVRGGGKKPYKQKGTGNARQGSTRAPHYVGGGSVFGPKPRDYEYNVPKKVKASALRCALSLRAKEGKLVIVDQWAVQPKRATHQVAAVLGKLGAPKALVVDIKGNEWLPRGVHNLASSKYLAQEGVNVYDVLRFETLILTRAATEALQARLKIHRHEEAGESA
jgi:large subunit ribosomal protein L4